jgi:hypothetical protein
MPGDGCDGSCKIESGCPTTTWYAHHNYDPTTGNPAPVGNSQFLQAEVAATKFDLADSAFPLTVDKVAVYASAGQSLTLRFYQDNGSVTDSHPSLETYSHFFVAASGWQEIELATPQTYATPQDFWIGLQGSADGMLVYGDGDGEATLNDIYGCDFFVLGFCLGTWNWDRFDSFGPTFVGVDDLLISVGRCD